jgi:hypothetical protein
VVDAFILKSFSFIKPIEIFYIMFYKLAIPTKAIGDLENMQTLAQKY